MNKILKVLFINTIVFISLLLNLKTNVSYCESYDKIQELISTQNKEELLSEKINDLNYILESKNKENDRYLLSTDIMQKKTNIYNFKITQINLLKIYLENQLSNCEYYKESLIKEVKEERLEALKESKISYIKGRWPLDNYTYISSKYGYRVHPISKKSSFHTGIDIPASKNTDVLASDDGIVVYAGYKNGYGNLVRIEHFDNKVTVYAHNNTIEVKEGDIVKKGQVISKVGSTGNSTGNHVHFEVIVNDNRINPIEGVTKDI